MKGHNYKIVIERAWVGKRAAFRAQFSEYKASRRKGSDRAIDRFFEMCDLYQKESGRKAWEGYVFRVRLVHADTDKVAGEEQFFNGKSKK